MAANISDGSGPLCVSSGIPFSTALLKNTSKKHGEEDWSDDGPLEGDESNALVMPGKKASKKRGRRVVVPELPTTRIERRLSKSKARKLANVEVRVAVGRAEVAFLTRRRLLRRR